jgi:type VI secretion system protein ImpK
MTPNFAKAVDPIFVHVLRLLDRLQEQGRASVSQNDKTATAEQEQYTLIGLFDRASATLGASQEWNLAKYALVSWIDEMLLEIPWEGRDWWSNNVLEVELFGTRLCHQQFYLRAQEASASPQRDALEVFYTCVVLGFRGIYGDPGMVNEWAQYQNLPTDLETWANRAVMGIRLAQDRPKLSDRRVEIAGAAPLRTRSVLVWSCVLFLILIFCNIVAYFRL